MARLSPADRRESIVAAALAVILRQGLAGTTVRDVAAELGCSSGLVHHYFDSMDALLAEAFERSAGADLGATRAAVLGGSDPVDRLRRFVGSYARADEDWAFQLWLDAWSEAARRPILGEVSRRLNEAWQALVAEIIRDGIAAGVMTCADADAAAWRILSLLDGLALQTVAHSGSVSRDQVIEWASTTAELDLGLPPGALR
ncbi:MAG: TetR family transcriptional regulator C-terminal domain-containing protein [Nocardioides sp.]